MKRTADFAPNRITAKAHSQFPEKQPISGDKSVWRYTGEIGFWQLLTGIGADIGIFEAKIEVWGPQIFFSCYFGKNHAWLMLVTIKNLIELQQRRQIFTGQTSAFGVPIFHKFEKSPKLYRISVLETARY